jgi:predicted NAD-dependent protein-ADP-ribosyltransferase YbiA (DUF1768 family)
VILKGKEWPTSEHYFQAMVCVVSMYVTCERCAGVLILEYRNLKAHLTKKKYDLQQVNLLHTRYCSTCVSTRSRVAGASASKKMGGDRKRPLRKDWEKVPRCLLLPYFFRSLTCIFCYSG